MTISAVLSASNIGASRLTDTFTVTFWPGYTQEVGFFPFPPVTLV